MAKEVKRRHGIFSREHEQIDEGGEELVTPKEERDARVMVLATTMDHSDIRGLITGTASLLRGAASV